MKAKDKAKELIEKYEELYSYENLAKQCALIAVDFSMQFITGDLTESFDKTLYLLDIKEEIEKYESKI